MYCRNCGCELKNGAKFCHKCGANQVDETTETITCPHCGKTIDCDCIICPECGKQVAELKHFDNNIIINNINNSVSSYADNAIKKCNKWISFILCLFFGIFGAHKFYEGHIGKGLLYLFTAGLLGIGWLFDLISILLKPHYYYVVKG